MSDWKEELAYQLRGRAVSYGVTVGASDVLLVPRSVNRTLLVISPPITGRITLVWGGAPAVDQQGLVISSGNPLAFFWLKDCGAAVAQEVRAIADAAGRVVGVLEVINAPP